jgi:putative hydrolase of the HAD superfamily
LTFVPRIHPVSGLRSRFPSVRAVFFDAVGTLIHPDPPAAVVYARTGRRFGSVLDDAVIASRFRDTFRRQEDRDRAAGWSTNEAREVARWRAIVAEVLDDVSDLEGCFAALYRHFAGADAWRLDGGTEALLPALASEGYVLGVASNFDHRLRGLIEALPGLRPVRNLVISSEVGWRKPAPQFFAALCERAALPPSQIHHVGDDLVNDYEGAIGTGLEALLLDPRRRASVPDGARLGALADLLA